MSEENMHQRDTTLDELNDALLYFENEFVSFGSRFINDSAVRQRYDRLARDTAAKMRSMALSTGNFREVSELANNLRNEAMNLMREASSDVGKAVAFKLKKEGLTFNFLTDRAAKKLFRRNFSELTNTSHQRKVFLEVIESSARSNLKMNRVASMIGPLGRGFLVATVAIAIYDVATAENKFRTAEKHATSIAFGSAFSIAGGWAGAICGPGAMVCVPLGVFVGGAMGALAVELIY